MSEDLVLPASDEARDSIIISNEEEVKSENAVAPKTADKKVDDDLEDGEIDDDDDNDEPIMTVDSKIVGAETPVPLPALIGSKPIQPSPVSNVMSVIDLMDEPVKKSKPKKHVNVVDDDFAGSIESAIAAALKKDGIMPPMPKILESREELDKQTEKEIIVPKSSRRRKRRRARDEREKDKDKDKDTRKKHRTSSPDNSHLKAPGPGMDEEDLDDDEMLCIRGGSPPHAGLMPNLPPLDSNMATKKEGYDSDDSYSSYDSYESANYSRFPSSRKKDGNSGSRSKRKERNTSRRDDERRAEKRSRRNYDDSAGEDKYQDRHPQQPRKLELCKFYLMECCAKKDKCSYMHSDFPCKYYYLGMECIYRNACKFSHGKPLTEQLRCVLLKHLETAPKEILGTFRRISRENALNLMNLTHERLCEEQGVENTLTRPTIPTQSVIQSQACGMRNGDLPSQHQHQHQHQQPMQPEIIPSLLDMVINKPPASTDTSTTLTTTAGALATAAGGQNTNKSEKQRKSRWCDSAVTNPFAAKQSSLEPPSSSAPSYLDLKNLTGILSTDRIEKLSQFGVVNLEQINQLTLLHLNSIGLTITEINEIQLNARNMAQLGVAGVHSDAVGPNISNAAATAAKSGSVQPSQDVDMRFLPSCLPLTTTTITTSTVTSEKSINDLSFSPPVHNSQPTGMPENTKCNTTSSGGIDYSQYLRDSNLAYDKSDYLDDEKDEEQLVIDDQDLDELDDNSSMTNPEAKDGSENDSKGSASLSYGDSNDSRLPPTIQLSDKLQNLLKEPTNLYTVNVSALLQSEGNKNSESVQASTSSSSKHAEDGFYGASTSTRRDTDIREEYRDPRHTDPRDEYRDPRTLEAREEYRDPRPNSRSTEQGRPTFSYRPINSDDESDRSRSPSPVLSLAQQMENFVPLYERQSMYDWTPKCIQEDLEYSQRNSKADKDMRLSRFLDNSNSDIDLRLPFQPVKGIQIAKEIEASLSLHAPIPYRITPIDVPEPKYSDLRHSFQREDSTDPRLRRIHHLPELSNSKALEAIGRSSRPTIASPSSADSSSSPPRGKEKPSTSASVVHGPPADPRRAAATATVTSSGLSPNPPMPAGSTQQNVEIRMLLQRSDWYKNLNSKYKIMVNQQLALISTELKRFHQDPSPNKVFDIQFITSNPNLQQILTNLEIYIDDNGQVAHVENDTENDIMMDGMSGMGGMGPGLDYGPRANVMMMLNDPNTSIQHRMMMQQQLGFLRSPPPNMNMMGLGGPSSQQGMFGNPGGMVPPFSSRNPRLGILGTGPGGNGGGGGFNPFGGNPGDNVGGAMMDSNYCGPSNPFANNINNFGSNGGNFGGGQQHNRGNRNNFNRQGGHRMNQNRRSYKSNNRRGGGSGGGGGSAGGGGNSNNSGAGTTNGGGASNGSNQNTNGDEEETWDDV